jgi:hypothetical protein
MSGYGYASDEVKSSPYHFGLNAGAAKLKKFEYTDKGGKEGAAMQALDVVFDINGRDVSCRKFPVNKVFVEGREVTDESEAPEAFAKAYAELSAWVVSIVKCYVSEEDIKKALSREITSFKQYCDLITALIPPNHAEIPLDIFMEYQWQPSGESTRTYLQVPGKVKQGKWICKAMEAIGKWNEIKSENPDNKESRALMYKDDAGNMHLFTRTGWYMNSNYAKLQSDGEEAVATTTANPESTGDFPWEVAVTE